MATRDLIQRVSALVESVKATTQLIAKLSRLSPDVVPSPEDDAAAPEEIRADLTADIQEAIKQHEEELAILKEDMDDAVPANGGRRSLIGNGSRRETGREQDAARLAAMVARVEEDIKTTRARFRRAQLQAKRNADQAVQRERTAYLTSLQTAAAQAATPSSESDDAAATEQSHAAMSNMLFAGRRLGGPRKDPKATQDDMLLSATSDVTASLRRTHALLASEVSRSRFAQETLDSSNKALEELNEKYGSLDSMLSQSKSLLNSLLRSNKSDTWYLETAYMMLAATLGWLLFRRLLYGPLWWFVWLPIRTTIYSVLWVFGTAIGFVGKTPRADAVMVNATTERSVAYASSSVIDSALHATAVARDSTRPARASTSTPASLSESIGNMVDGVSAEALRPAATGAAADKGTDQSQQEEGDQQPGQGQAQARRGDGQPLRERDETTEPRNPKKRMFEEPPRDQQQQQQQRDEL